MIVDKKNKKVVGGKKPKGSAADDAPVMTKYQQMPTNGLIDVFKAIKDMLRKIRWEYGNDQSPLIFNTVQHDDGQFERIVRKQHNLEDGIAFPAAFIHFIDIHWLKPSSRIKEGRATLRLRFVLNRLNVHDNDDTEAEGYYVIERIKQEFALHHNEYECLQKRLSMNYCYKTLSFDDSLQPWWMDWEVWFDEENIWFTRNWKQVTFVCPPFTNHADQDPSLPGVNPDKHNNLDHPRTYDEATKFVYEGVVPENTAGQTDPDDIYNTED